MNTKVTEYLDRLKIPYKIKHHARSVFTSEDAAKERGVRLSQIIKTMLLIDQKHGVVAVLPAHKKLDLKKLKKLSGSKNLHFMDKESVEKEANLVVGAIAPVAEMLKGMAIFVDPSVFYEDQVDISSGDPRAGVELHRDGLRTLLGEAVHADITKEG